MLMPNWVSAYRKDWLRPDILAGLTTAAVVIPKAMAYATIAGLPVQVGLYTAFPADGDLRGAGDLSRAQREHHHNSCHSGRDRAWPRGARWRSGIPAASCGHA